MYKLTTNPGILTPLDRPAMLQFQHEDKQHLLWPGIQTAAGQSLIISKHILVQIIASVLCSGCFVYSYAITFEFFYIDFTLLDGESGKY